MSAGKPGSDIRISRRSLLSGLIAVHVLAALLVMLVSLPLAPLLGRHPIEMLVGLCFAQASLLAAWLVVGKTSWQLRTSVTLCGMAADCALVLLVTQKFGGPITEAVWIVFLTLAPAVTVAAALLALRPLGLCIERVQSGESLPTGRFLRQFSVRYLLTATFVIALMLAAVQATRQHLAPYRAIGEAVMLGLVFGSCTLAALWLFLGQLRLWRRILSFALLAICLGGSLWLDPQGEIFVVLVAQSIVQAATLVILRWCRYRLVASDRLAAHSGL